MLIGYARVSTEDQSLALQRDALRAAGCKQVGYNPKALADLTDTRLPEIRRFLKGQLDTDRTDELSTLLRRAGLPI